jgi:hypothetical protein
MLFYPIVDPCFLHLEKVFHCPRMVIVLPSPFFENTAGKIRAPRAEFQTSAIDAALQDLAVR